VNHVERVLQHAADLFAAASEVVVMMVVLVVTDAAASAVPLEGRHISGLRGLPESLGELLRQFAGVAGRTLSRGRQLIRNLLRDFLELCRILLGQPR
jgi:hypothetical protein